MEINWRKEVVKGVRDHIKGEKTERDRRVVCDLIQRKGEIKLDEGRLEGGLDKKMKWNKLRRRLRKLLREKEVT